nr:MAG TPA: hypothetical protein [Caudoviricetes sp.]
MINYISTKREPNNISIIFIIFKWIFKSHFYLYFFIY